VPATGIALLYDALGDREHALSWLERGVREYDFLLRTYGRGRAFDHLRADPRGAALFARMVAPNDSMERRE